MGRRNDDTVSGIPSYPSCSFLTSPTHIDSLRLPLDRVRMADDAHFSGCDDDYIYMTMMTIRRLNNITHPLPPFDI
jgi:hypothetical protein